MSVTEALNATIPASTSPATVRGNGEDAGIELTRCTRNIGYSG